MNKTPCSCCSRPLASSLYIDGAERKSCAWCSLEAGCHIYHPLADFGMWHAPNADGDRPYMQSECIVAYRRRVGDPHGAVTMETCEHALLRGQRGRPARHPAVAEILEVKAAEAAEALAADHAPGRQLTACPPAARPPKPRPKNLAAPAAPRPRLTLVSEAAARDYKMSDQYEVGDTIRHPKFGLGLACVVEARLVVVQFDEREVRLAHCKPGAIALKEAA